MIIDNYYWEKEWKCNWIQNFTFISQSQTFVFALLNRLNPRGKLSNFSPQIDISN